jgi:hypothetical protein
LKAWFEAYYAQTNLEQFFLGLLVTKIEREVKGACLEFKIFGIYWILSPFEPFLGIRG